MYSIQLFFIFVLTMIIVFFTFSSSFCIIFWMVHSIIQKLSQWLRMGILFLRQRLFPLKMGAWQKLRIKILLWKALAQLPCMINGLHLQYLVNAQKPDMRYCYLFIYLFFIVWICFWPSLLFSEQSIGHIFSACCSSCARQDVHIWRKPQWSLP